MQKLKTKEKVNKFFEKANKELFESKPATVRDWFEILTSMVGIVVVAVSWAGSSLLGLVVRYQLFILVGIKIF